MNDYYVYTLESSLTGQVFYVGKGHDNRIGDHERNARKGMQSHTCHTIRKIWSDGGRVIKRKVAIDLPEGEAYKQEAELIRQYGRENLTNKTDGGDSGGGRPKEREDAQGILLVKVYQSLLSKLDTARGPLSRRQFVEQWLETL